MSASKHGGRTAARSLRPLVGPAALLIIVGIFGALYPTTFLSPQNLLVNVLDTVSFLVIVAAAQTIVMVVGDSVVITLLLSFSGAFQSFLQTLPEIRRLRSERLKRQAETAAPKPYRQRVQEALKQYEERIDKKAQEKTEAQGPCVCADSSPSGPDGSALEGFHRAA